MVFANLSKLEARSPTKFSGEPSSIKDPVTLCITLEEGPLAIGALVDDPTIIRVLSGGRQTKFISFKSQGGGSRLLTKLKEGDGRGTRSSSTNPRLKTRTPNARRSLYGDGEEL
ncbi:hypothetical protein OPQ81_000988 [Rhizoctonia solani]|nr:hypothetical protein OPQ81_000988 [Rhizoctonia solani]